MKEKCLADGSPVFVLYRRKEIQAKNQTETKKNAHSRKDGADKKHLFQTNFKLSTLEFSAEVTV